MLQLNLLSLDTLQDVGIAVVGLTVSAPSCMCIHRDRIGQLHSQYWHRLSGRVASGPLIRCRRLCGLQSKGSLCWDDWIHSLQCPGHCASFVVVRFVTSELSFGGDNSKNVLVLC